MTTNNPNNGGILLLTENHTIKPFDCEDDDLNDFLFNEAIPYTKEMLATTFIIENDERTLGYYSLLSDSFRVEETNFASKTQYKNFLRELVPHPKRHLKGFPAIKIGRLAIDKTFKGKGLFALIVNAIIADCIHINQKHACRLITIDAYKKAIPFYERFGFQFLTENDKDLNIRQMFLDLSKIKDF